MEYITTPTVSEILREEFMEPLGTTDLPPSENARGNQCSAVSGAGYPA